jgi:hypothetical protein
MVRCAEKKNEPSSSLRRAEIGLKPLSRMISVKSEAENIE